jgi:hypothetical protein
VSAMMALPVDDELAGDLDAVEAPIGDPWRTP